MQLLKRTYYPALDGLRAVAFLMVFAIHSVTPEMPRVLMARWSPFEWGWVGVDIFFVLSGFLITGILFNSLETRAYFRNFYLRRSLRIFPLYFGVWSVLLLLTPVLHIAWNGYNATYPAYIGNLFISGGSLRLHSDPSILQLSAGALKGLGVGHFWSLCVEEQFYLVWPAVVYLVRKRETLLKLCLSYMAFTPVLRTVCVILHPEWRASFALYGATPFRLDSLLWGAALFLWLRDTDWETPQLRRAAFGTLGAVPVLFAIALCIAPMTVDRTNVINATVTVGFSIFAAGSCALLLFCLDETTALHRLLRKPLLSRLGRISYGLYVFHMFALQAALAVLPDRRWLMLRPVLAFVVTVACAEVSYHFFELPFLRLKDRLAPGVGQSATSRAVGRRLRPTNPLTVLLPFTSGRRS